jgi:hypothetical protein
LETVPNARVWVLLQRGLGAIAAITPYDSSLGSMLSCFNEIAGIITITTITPYLKFFMAVCDTST